MNISKENIDALNAVLTLEFDKADYEPQAEKAVKDYAKRINIKGFRPGHAPIAMVKKMYGNSILVDTINTLVGNQLSQYIAENKIDILGEPLPAQDQQPIDFDQPLDKITLKFDLGLSPEVNVTVDKNLTIPQYTITVDDKAIDAQIKNITGRLGGQEPVEVASEKSMLKGTLELGDTKNEKALASVEVIKDEAEKAKFVGKKAGDVVEFEIRKAYPDTTEISYLLGISKEEAEAVAEGAIAKMTLSEVSEFKEAELNNELFAKVFPKENIENEVDFRTKVAEQVAKNNEFSQDFRFALDVRKALLNAAGELQLPEEFLKRWLTAVNKDNDKFTPDVLTNEFPKFLEDLKWQVVKNRVARAHEIKVDNQDLLNQAKKQVRLQFMRYGIADVPEENLNEYAANMLKNEEQRGHIVEGALEDKLVQLAKDNANVESKNIQEDEFNKLFENEK